jgi:hypothetical protein
VSLQSTALRRIRFRRDKQARLSFMAAGFVFDTTSGDDG